MKVTSKFHLRSPPKCFQTDCFKPCQEERLIQTFAKKPKTGEGGGGGLGEGGYCALFRDKAR